MRKSMRTSINTRKKNPFRVSFLSVTVICCVALSIVFFYISYINNKATQDKYAQGKTELIMGDLETQLQMMKNVAARIKSNYEFYPYYFKKSIDREMKMLETFEQYRYYTALTEEYFLFYGDDWIYRSTGTTIDLDVFMQYKSKNEEERLRFEEKLNEMRTEKKGIVEELEIVSAFNEIYVLIPLRVSDGKQYNTIVLVFSVKKSALKERFNVVGGGIDGNVILYGEDGVLYSDQAKADLAEQRNVFTVASQDGQYTLCYQPEREYSMQGGLFLLQILLVMMDVILVFAISNIFAERAYKPIQVMTEKYRAENFREKEQHENALAELNYMMDSMLQSNLEANLQIQKNQKILRNQILQMIMNGNVSAEGLSYLDKVEIYLPGPFYCVLSISFEEEEDVTEKFLCELQEELELLTDANEKEYIYTTCSLEKKLLNAICSVQTEEEKDELIETVCDVAESFAYKPMVGIGNTYQVLGNVSASWLESMDSIQNKKRKFEKEGENIFIYNTEELRRISAALESGNEEAALERLKYYIEGFDDKPVSMLMLQYILSDFLGEIRRLDEKYKLKMSTQNVSMLISAKCVQDFESVAKRVIHEFCEGYEGIRSQMKEEETNRICEYINTHFAEYDISIENVAANMHISTEAVRQAVLQHTGKMYRDYLIYLRIEYAKVLLRQENMPVAELCQKVGYGNVSYFIKLFREMTGVTPAKYRRNAVDKS